MSNPQASIVLCAHPDSPGTAVESVRATLAWTPGPVLAITYTVAGMIDQLRIPPFRAPRKSDRLWCHTCFELFIGAENDAEYYELNFSPSGEWAAYGFRDYREGGPVESDAIEPKITMTRDAQTLDLSAAVPLNGLPGLQSDVALWVGLAAVLEAVDGSLSYWALKHPPGKPDFHHSGNFALRIEPAVGDGAGIVYTGAP